MILGLAELIKQLEDIADVSPENLLPGVQVIFDESQRLVPVKTGDLKRSGHIDQSGEDVQIVYDKDYAPFVEYGTSKMAAQPFLRPAIEGKQSEALRAVADAVQQEIKEKVS